MPVVRLRADLTIPAARGRLASRFSAPGGCMVNFILDGPVALLLLAAGSGSSARVSHLTDWRCTAGIPRSSAAEAPRGPFTGDRVGTCREHGLQARYLHPSTLPG